MLLALTMMAAEAAPDLIIDDIVPVCIAAGVPGLKVLVRNPTQEAAGGFWTDAYFGRSLPPPGPPFPAGDRWVWVPSLAGFATYTWVLDMSGSGGWSGWVDAVADTFDGLAESNELNNIRSENLVIPTCL